MGAVRLGKLALLAVLAACIGRMYSRAHPFGFSGTFLELS
jgi:hypothetical protein